MSVPEAPRTALILAGGQGTRLRPMTDKLPKPLLPVAGRPMLEHILASLQQHGVTRAAIATGYHADQIQHYFGDGARFGLELRYIQENENEPLGSGGAVRNVFEQLPEFFDSTFLVTNADVLNDVDLWAAFATHRAHQAQATIICGKVDDPAGFGICEIGQDDRIVRFLEKPDPADTASRWANLGWWIFEPSLLARLAPGYSRIEDTLFPELIASDTALYTYRHTGYWLDVGTHERYEQAQRDAAAGRFPLVG